jgi:membrane fusion protein (multidrug efflux system)
MKIIENQNIHTTSSVMSISIITKSFFLILLIGGLSACSGSSKEKDPVAQLGALKEQRAALESQISALEKDLESKGLIEKRLRTIGTQNIQPAMFRHYIDLQGRVDADESVAATSKIPGTITRILISNGDHVKQGQLMAQLDDAVILKSLDELEGQLTVATDLFNRQKSLWEQNIGSEVQYIQAKNAKESLERSIATLKENWANTKIYAPTSGTVDLVILRPGQAISPGIPLCNILNLEDLVIKGEVTEAYASKVKRGDAVQVYFPDLNKEVDSRVTYVSQSINVLNRTFTIECELGKGDYRANQIAVLKIVDYQNPKAIAIPVNYVQTGEDGDFVLTLDTGEGAAGEGIVRKAPIEVGQNYNGYVEILSGLKEGDKLISTGFQDVNIGEKVKYQ